MSARVLLAVLLLSACAAPPTATVDARDVTVSSEAPLRRVVVRDAAGLVLARRDVDGELHTLALRHGAPPGAALQIEAIARTGAQLALVVPPAPDPVQIALDAPAGRGEVPLQERHRFPVVGDAQVQVGVVVTLAEPGPVALSLGGATERWVTAAPGERRVWLPPAPREPATLTVEAGGRTFASVLEPVPVDPAAARAALRLLSVDFPADAQGHPEAARPAGRVTLPAPWWRGALRSLGLGTRARDPNAPWAWAAVRLRNEGAEDLDVALSSRVLDGDVPAAAFAPRERDRVGASGRVAVLLRVPAGASSTAALPVFVEPGALPEGASLFTHELTVTPLGASAPLWVERAPLAVTRGSTWISLGFGLALLGGALGTGAVVLRLRVWLRGLSTRSLVTTAVLATLGFLASGAATLASAALAAVSGPFALFLTALLDDALRYALLATLLVQLPRPGVAAIFLLQTWLMRGVALGAFSPLDLFDVGGRIAWLEGALWLAGVTRGRPGWPRLAAACAGASVVTSLAGVCAAMVLYRLYYAGWYVAAIVAGPGFLYVLLATWLGAGLARSLRRVED